MRRLLMILAIGIAPFLAACAGVANPETGERQSPVEALLQATAQDARVAHQLAVASGDESGQRCWATVEQVAAEKGGDGTVTLAVVGPLSAWQKARNVRMIIDDGIDERVRRDCAVLVFDAIRTGRRIAGRLVPLL